MFSPYDFGKCIYFLITGVFTVIPNNKKLNQTTCYNSAEITFALGLSLRIAEHESRGMNKPNFPTKQLVFFSS